jgi:hypothetical protein
MMHYLTSKNITPRREAAGKSVLIFPALRAGRCVFLVKKYSKDGSSHPATSIKGICERSMYKKVGGLFPAQE